MTKREENIIRSREVKINLKKGGTGNGRKWSWGKKKKRKWKIKYKIKKEAQDPGIRKKGGKKEKEIKEKTTTWKNVK